VIGTFQRAMAGY
jgi:hypothetical protein